MTTWRDVAPDDHVPIGVAGYFRAIVKLVPLAATLTLGLAIVLALRVLERPLFGYDRPLSPHVTRGVSRLSLRIIGLRCQARGQPMRARGAVVSNHASWLDIFVLNAHQTVYFVSKSEVSRWFFVGWLARATGTVFIARDPRAAKEQRALFEARLRAGHKLMFFPEGTSTDGLRVLPFKSTLFAAFYSPGLDHIMNIQPVTVVYRAPEGQGERFYGWWGDMNFGAHVLKTLAAPRQGSVAVVFHSPIAADAFESRKALCRRCEEAVAAELKEALGPRFRA